MGILLISAALYLVAILAFLLLVALCKAAAVADQILEDEQHHIPPKGF